MKDKKPTGARIKPSQERKKERKKDFPSSFDFSRKDLIGQKEKALIPWRFQSHPSDYCNHFMASPKTRAAQKFLKKGAF